MFVDFKITCVPQDDIFLTCYDGENGTGDDEAGDGEGTPPSEENKGGTPPGGKPKTFDETEVNKIVEERLKRDRQKQTKEREKLATELETLRKGVGLTEAEKEKLTAQIEELRTQGMTEQQKAKIAREKAEKEWKSEKEVLEKDRNRWKDEYTEFRKKQEITQSAIEAGANPQSVKFLEALLSPKTRLVEENDEDGKSKGTHTARVRMEGKNKEGKSVELDFSVAEAVKYMKDSPDEFGVLFLTDVTPGLGGGNGTAGKKQIVTTKMPMSEYMKQRDKDPHGLGLVRQ